jgi:hypothetical protein
MPETLENMITATTMRHAIRAKLRAGTSRRAISMLIAYYAPADAHSRDDGSGVQRLAVEVIPHGRRPAFLVELDLLGLSGPPEEEVEIIAFAS